LEFLEMLLHINMGLSLFPGGWPCATLCGETWLSFLYVPQASATVIILLG